MQNKRQKERDLNRRQERANSVSWRPFVLNDVQTYGTVRINIWMIQVRGESHFSWRFRRIIFGEDHPKWKYSSFPLSVVRSHDRCIPNKQIFFVDWTCAHSFRWFRFNLFQVRHKSECRFGRRSSRVPVFKSNSLVKRFHSCWKLHQFLITKCIRFIFAEENLTLDSFWKQIEV